MDVTDNRAGLSAQMPQRETTVKKDREILEDGYVLHGPRSKFKELVFSVKVWWETFKGVRKLHNVGPCVSIFGSARFKEDHPHYTMARQVAGEVSKLGFTVMTGGGPGVMEGANRGAREAGGKSVACNIRLPHEQDPNPYLDKYVDIKYFFVRKVLLFKYSYAFVVLPGGFGTMDETFEVLTLIQTSKLQKFPVVLMGKEYWAKLLEFIDHMIEAGTISARDLDLFLVTDDAHEAMDHIEKYAIRAFQLEKRKAPLRRI